jgi:hypothetical protein
MIRFISLAAVSLLLATGCGKKKDFDDPSSKTGGVGPATASVPTVAANPIAINNGGGSGGAVQAVRKAVTRTVDQNDLKNIHLYIENASLASNRMPSKKEIMEALKSDPGSAKLVKMIEDGDIVLTDIKQREGVWAYPKHVLQDGGYIISNEGVVRISNVDLQEKLKAQQ